MEHCVFLPLIKIQMHSCKSWINEAKTCLSCDKFSHRSRMMFLDKNEVIPFQKCPWNALCKNGILLKISLFSKPNLKTSFSIKHLNTFICTLNSLLNKIRAMNLSRDCFVNFLLIQYFDSLCKDIKRN